jgi:LuxR family transcriptional regulator, maltose regulon positive regulatory protein
VTDLPLPPLAETKLLAPQVRPETFMRPRIQKALDAGRQSRLTLVAAPPGYGKTTAVRASCSNRDEALVWVSLARNDNDPVHLWRYAATAVDRVRSGLGGGALRRLGAPGGAIEDPVIELMKGLTTYGDPVTLVFDDFHHVTETECLESIDFALEYLPASTHLLLLTRIDPALRLAQLRAEGTLAELRAEHLAFTEEEAFELLVVRGGLALDVDEVALLHARTEGWPAALNLALVWLRNVEDPHAAVRDFGGTHRFVSDYLNQVVFASLDDDSRAFLLEASAVGECTAELCDDVLCRHDSEAMLELLDRSNLLVNRLEQGRWFRLHGLLREFAGFELEARQTGRTAEIQRRAAEWCRSHNLPIEAVEHASAASDHELVAEILLEQHLPMIRTGHARTLLAWIRTLPEEQLLAHPELSMAAATASGLLGKATIEQRRFLAVAARAKKERPDRFTPYADAGIAMVRAFTLDGGVAAAIAEGARAVEIAPADVLVGSLAAYAHALYFAGDSERAWSTALEAVQHPEAERRSTAHAIARATMALLALERGLPNVARTHAAVAKKMLGRIHSSRSWLGANVSVALASVLIAEGRLGDAERELAHAEHLFEDEIPTAHHAWVLLLIAQVRCRRGRLDDAVATLATAREEIAGLGDVGRLARLLADVEREFADARTRASEGEVLEAPTEAELPVLRLLATDLSAREIGKTLFLSPNTIRTHTRVIYRKLGVNSRADAVARAVALGFLDEQAVETVHLGERTKGAA